MAEMRRNCALCAAEAAVYCPSDSAFLCTACDAKVHCANFLVARHVRSYICPHCRSFEGSRFSGSGVAAPAIVSCRTCSPVGDDDDSLSSSSSCVSSTGEAAEEGEVSGTATSVSSSRKRRASSVCDRKGAATSAAVNLKAEGVLINWCRAFGVEDARVVRTAVELLTGCLDKMAVLPFRVALAASLWVAMRLCSVRHDLRRLEQISGVPAKLILATESRIARVLKRRRSRADHEEGWAEC